MDKFVYPSLRSRLKAEYKIYLLALLFILIADSIGQIQIPLGPGQFILFPIFYALIMGVLSGPENKRGEGGIKACYRRHLSFYRKAGDQRGRQP